MIIYDLENNTLLSEQIRDTFFTVLALGNFDGVHIGHRVLLEKTVLTAKSLGIHPAVWTFASPPFPSKAKMLTTMEEKLILFRELGIQYVFAEDFSAVSHVPPDVFAREILLRHCGARSVICGYNYRFGHLAAGTPKMLDALLCPAKVSVNIIPPVEIGGIPVSATRIRRLLDSGDTLGAGNCLGRLFSVVLPISHGKQLGRTIGFPTVNQYPTPDMQIPGIGTYASSVIVDGKMLPAVTNIGYRPTVSSFETTPNIETHIIGYNGDLYGKNIRVLFRQKLRDERKFNDLNELKNQILLDIKASSVDFDN